MLMQILRLLMLRVLPRRLIPILTVVELVFLARRMRRRGRQPVAPRKLVTAEDPSSLSARCRSSAAGAAIYPVNVP